MSLEDHRPTTRRAFLTSAVTGAITGTAGCHVSMPTLQLGDPDPPPFGPVEHGWRMAGRDAANTAHNPGADGPRSEPESIWEFDVRGRGNPRAVAAGRTLAIAANETLYVYDLAAGELAWTKSVGTGLGQPALGDGRLYVRTADQELSCLDVETGESVWSATTEGWVRVPRVNDRLVLVNDQERIMYAFDAEDGSEKWRYTEERLLRGHSHPVTEDGLYLGTGNELVVLDVDTGTERTRLNGVEGRPTLVDETIYVGGNEMAAHRLDGKTLWNTEADWVAGGFYTPTILNERAVATISGGNIGMLSVESGELLWRDEDRSWDGRSITDGSMVYVASGNRARRVYALDPLTETVEWTKRAPEVPANLRVIDDMLLVGIDTGKLLALA